MVLTAGSAGRGTLTGACIGVGGLSRPSLSVGPPVPAASDDCARGSTLSLWSEDLTFLPRPSPVLFAANAAKSREGTRHTTETIKAESLFAELRYMPFLRSVKRN